MTVRPVEVFLPPRRHERGEILRVGMLGVLLPLP